LFLTIDNGTCFLWTSESDFKEIKGSDYGGKSNTFIDVCALQEVLALLDGTSLRNLLTVQIPILY
jgi:hypothetical protein